MELIEKHDLCKIHYLNSLSFKEFKALCGNSCKNEEDRKIQFNILKEFCKTNIKTRGETKRIYAYSLQTSLITGGRLYCGNSVQGLKAVFRGFLMTHTTDIDMKNCHPVLLRYICKKHNILCPNLESYINNRDNILSEFENKDEAKIMFLKSLNDDKHNFKVSNKTFKDFDKEMKYLQDTITSLECYADIKNSVPNDKKYNWNGCTINRILCMYENQVLQSCISALNKRNINICALMFDGIMPYGYYYGDNELLEYITSYVENEFNGLEMEWAYKPHKDTIVIPNDFVVSEVVKSKPKIGVSFETMVEEFEKTHCKVVNKSIFVKITDDGTVLMTLKQLETAYAHMSFDTYMKDGKVFVTFDDKSDTVVPQSFIKRWVSHCHNIRRYEDMDVYPNPSFCPPNILNMWSPFACEKLTTSYVKNEEGLFYILNHIRILCNNDDVVCDYFIKWIAQMIQYPEIKTICITLISDEGSGKGTLMKLIQKMLGSDKYYETSKPSRDVWGDFNAIMKDTFFVNLNELSKQETLQAEGVIKTLITDEAMTINQKGISQYKVKSYHRFIITTNNDDPIKTKKGDRRNLIIRSSDEKKGNTEYFDTLNAYLDDDNVIRTCYDYFKSIEGMNIFRSIKLPTTEYQEDMKGINESPIEQWLKNFVEKNCDLETITLASGRVYDTFKSWCEFNKVKYEVTSIKFAVRLKNLKIDGVEKGQATKTGKTVLFDIEKLKNYFNIGELVECEETDCCLY
jgi:hypothetical protein